MNLEEAVPQQSDLATDIDAPAPVSATHAKPPLLKRWARRMLRPQASSHLRRGVRGQSLIELALSLPFLITLLLALLEIGFLIRSHLTILYATREGARAEAAAGNTEPDADKWPIKDNSSTYLQMSDGDTVMVNNVNAALQGERANVLFLSSYKADNTYGDPCQNSGAGGWATSNGNTCTMNASTTTNFANWPVYKATAGGTTIYFQEVFQRLAGPDYGFSRQLMTGEYGTQACPPQAPYANSCGSNVNNLPGNWFNTGSNLVAGYPPNPWYPGYRCEADPGTPTYPGSTGFQQSDVNAAGGSYYNFEPNGGSTAPTTRDWAGVRIDYKHSWITPWFPGSPLVLSDRSVYNLEPTFQKNIAVITCLNSPNE